MQIRKIYNYSFLLIAAFPLLSLRWSTNLIIIWGLLSVVQFFYDKIYKDLDRKDITSFFILSLYYLLLLVSFLISGFDEEILKFLETDAPFLVFPLLVIINKKVIDKKTLNRSLLVFFVSNVILALKSWSQILNIGFAKLQAENNFYQPVFRNLFFEETNIHLPYLGLLFVFSIGIGISWVLRGKLNFYIKLGIFLACALLLISIVTFSARMSLFTFIIMSGYLLYKSIKGIKIKIIGILSLLLIAFFLITQTPIKNRFDEVLKAKMELPNEKFNKKEHEVNFRYGIYYCAQPLLNKGFWWGIGKENIAKELQACYDTFTFKGANDFQKVYYNTHNQYVDVLLSYGIFGFLLVITSLFFGLLKDPSTLYKLFLMIVGLALVTENLFDRQIGVVFYTFFNTLFYIKQTKQR
ncbi:O-antigen ligase family protein [Tenacibaculum sp. TC6]|uniref:O-antigen ligase family protein n=1 Tax=Tenacibaculum sp. TC6 TaxID=3423223 RepID=UPI003D36B80B